MMNKLLRQRRRIAFAFLFAQLSLLRIVPEITPVVTGTAIIMAMVILLVIAGRRTRRLVECAAIALFISTAAPSLFIGSAVFMLTTLFAYAVFYGPLLDHLPVRIGLRSRKVFSAPFDYRTTWQKTVPGQGHPAAYWTGTMMSFQTDSDDDATLYLTFRDENGAIEEVTATYLKLTPMHSARYLIERDTQQMGEEVIMSYRFHRTSDEVTSILSDMQVSGLPIRVALERFFDDVLGDELDHFATMNACKRTWSYRDKKSAALTSEFGNTTVKLGLNTGTTGSAQEAKPLKAVETRLSA